MSQPGESVLSPHRADWFALLVACLRLAINTKCLGLSLAGLLVTTAGWKLAGLVVTGTDVEARSARSFQAVAASWRGGIPQPIRACPYLLTHLPAAAETWPIDPVWGVPYRLAEPFRRLFTMGRSWTTLTYYLLGGLISLSAWAFFGGAVARIAVVQLALRRQLGLRQALRFAQGKWVAFFSGPALALLGIAMLAFPFIALGWLMRLAVGVLLAGVLWVGVLLAASLMAVLALVLMFAWPLMWGAIASEDGDAFDALSRSYAYTSQRPLHYLFYASIAACLGLAGWLLAWCFAETMIDFSFWAVSLGGGNERVEALIQRVQSPGAAPASTFEAGADLMGWAVGLVRAAASGFSFSYFWCVAAALYLLLRRDTDQTQLDDVVFDEPSSAETAVEAKVDEGERATAE